MKRNPLKIVWAHRVRLMFLFIIAMILSLLAVSCFDYFDWSDDASPALRDNAGDVWVDSSSGLMWQDASHCCYDLYQAKSYCQDLDWDGNDDWHLPTISELRSLIRGCDATETDGSCGVTDKCLYNSCEDDSCYECSSDGGPVDGCYWPSLSNGECSWYLSSSVVDDSVFSAWYVSFNRGHVNNGDIDGDYNVRCVRVAHEFGDEDDFSPIDNCDTADVYEAMVWLFDTCYDIEDNDGNVMSPVDMCRNATADDIDCFMNCYDDFDSCGSDVDHMYDCVVSCLEQSEIVKRQ